jgi:membrane protein implicated in regulation of membrane protease activity
MDLSSIYFICFAVGLLFAMISALFAGVFGGHDGSPAGDTAHAEAGFGAHEMPGFSALSPTTIASFVTAFGGFGMIFSKIPVLASPWLSAPLAAIGGLGVAALVFAVFRKLFHATQSSSEGRVGALVGHAATVETPIPANGVGEISYVQAGSRYTAPARADDSRSIAAGTSVHIVRVTGTQFYVTND